MLVKSCIEWLRSVASFAAGMLLSVSCRLPDNQRVRNMDYLFFGVPLALGQGVKQA